MERDGREEVEKMEGKVVGKIRESWKERKKDMVNELKNGPMRQTPPTTPPVPLPNTFSLPPYPRATPKRKVQAFFPP